MVGGGGNNKSQAEAKEDHRSYEKPRVINTTPLSLYTVVPLAGLDEGEYQGSAGRLVASPFLFL